jgi:hypothetical protein
MEMLKFTRKEIIDAIKSLEVNLKVNKEMALTSLSEKDRKWHEEQIPLIQKRILELEVMLIKCGFTNESKITNTKSENILL